MLDLSFVNSTQYQAFARPFFKKIIEVASKEVGLGKKQIGLSVNLVGKAKMRGLNKKYRGEDKPTNVLSFPLHNSLLPNKTKETILELGDIFVCPEVVLQNIKQSGRTMKAEISFLVVHGFLHLLGYDHEKLIVEKKEMFALQNRILKKLG